MCYISVEVFCQLTWKHPDLPLSKDDFGITWCELALQYTIFAGKCLPVWLHDSDKGYAVPYDFFSEQVALQKPEFRGLGHQTSAFRAVVRHLENTSRCHLYPRYKKTGASSLIRLGFHRSLIGGIAARPNMQQNELTYATLAHYASAPGQVYPLNVRAPFKPRLDRALITHDEAEVWSFDTKSKTMHSSQAESCLTLMDCLN